MTWGSKGQFKAFAATGFKDEEKWFDYLKAANLHLTGDIEILNMPEKGTPRFLILTQTDSAAPVLIQKDMQWGLKPAMADHCSCED